MQLPVKQTKPFNKITTAVYYCSSIQETAAAPENTHTHACNSTHTHIKARKHIYTQTKKPTNFTERQKNKTHPPYS